MTRHENIKFYLTYMTLILILEIVIKNINFKVRLGSMLPYIYDQETEVPQGCILSVTIFSLKINKIAYTLNKDTNYSLC